MGLKQLVIIPARGGSKGIPGKNIKDLCGKPLIAYTINYAKKIVDASDICLSTDSQDIIEVAREYGLHSSFVRPEILGNDDSGMYEVVIHALEYYENLGIRYDVVLLLQPTSPFRLKKHYKELIELYNSDTDMIVSVIKAKANPYFLLMEENNDGYLEKSKMGQFVYRQEAPIVYQINGSLYLYNVNSLKKFNAFGEFKRIKKYLMDQNYSTDIDDMTDWQYAEFLISRNLIEFD